MAILKKDLSALRNDFKALEKKMEKLLKAAEPNAKPQKTTKANNYSLLEGIFDEPIRDSVVLWKIRS